VNKTVCIIGAGIGGLSIAALLVKGGVGVTVFEKASKIGGRTASIIYRNHILDNGFHIMPFYKKSAIYEIFKKVGIKDRLILAKVRDIAFYDGHTFHKYPRGINDILRLSLIPLQSRINLLKILLPLAFSGLEKTAKWDEISLKQITENLDIETKSFFDAVCMLAFADIPEHISLGEFARTIIRANPFRGGTSEFGYPESGGYDIIAKIIAEYIGRARTGSKIILNSAIKRILIENGKVKGVVTLEGEFIEYGCVIVSYPAYQAINQLFEADIFDNQFINKVNRLNKTTSVVEVHFAISKRIDERQVVFPVGNQFTTKGIFFVSNITQSVSPTGEHLILVGTPVSSQDATSPQAIRMVSDRMKDDLQKIYPNFRQALLWERPMAWELVESVVKEPGLVWKQKMPHEVDQVKGLFFVGDSTVSYSIGTDSAAHSALLCYPKIISYLHNSG
jgi:protoporphyrinogen oxidase